MTADFLIVGAGIGGAVLAEMLGRAGKKVIILEKSASHPPWTRPEILWPGTVERLFAFRPRDEFQEAMLPLQGVTIFNNERFNLAISRETFDSAHVVPWSTDPHLTRAVLLASSSFEVRRGVEVTEILRQDGRVVGVRTREGGNTAALDVLATWTVGDDGGNSFVRRSCGLEFKTRLIPVDIFCFKFDWPSMFPSGCVCGFPNFNCGSCGIIAWGGLPLPNGKGAGIIAVLNEDCDAQCTVEKFRAELRAIHPVVDEVVGSRRFPDDFWRVHNLQWGHAPRYGFPGAVLMGDAAHPVSPAGGQGANMSIADAIVLAKLFLSNSTNVVEEYERRRWPANRRSMRPTCALSILLNLPRWCRPTPLVLRRLAPLANFEALKRFGVRQVSTLFEERNLGRQTS